jgi:hypothetical protein
MFKFLQRRFFYVIIIMKMCFPLLRRGKYGMENFMKKQFLAAVITAILSLTSGLSVFGANAANITVSQLLGFDTPSAQTLPDTDILTDYPYYTVSVDWGLSASQPFAEGETRTALFTLSAKSEDFTFAGNTNFANFIPGKTPIVVFNTGDSVLLEISFTTNSSRTIVIAPVIGFNAPLPLATPRRITDVDTRYEGYNITSISWSPSVTKFAYGGAYTATVTLTATAGYTFPPIIGYGNSLSSFYPGAVCVSNTGSVLVLQIAFPELPPKPVVTTKIQLRTLYMSNGDTITPPIDPEMPPEITPNVLDDKDFNVHYPVSVTATRNGELFFSQGAVAQGEKIYEETETMGEYVYIFSFAGAEESDAIYAPSEAVFSYFVNDRPRSKSGVVIDTYVSEEPIDIPLTDLVIDTYGKLQVRSTHNGPSNKDIGTLTITENGGLSFLPKSAGTTFAAIEITDGRAEASVQITFNVIEKDLPPIIGNNPTPPAPLTPYIPAPPPVPIVTVTPITPKPTKDGTVEAGVNPSGSLNSDSTAAAVKAAAKNGEEKVIVNAPEELKGISETAINKLLAAAPEVTIAQNFTDENIRITIPLKAGMGTIYTGITPVPTGTGIAAFATNQKTDFGTNVRYALDLDIDASTFADCEDWGGGKIIYVYINGTTRVAGIYKNGKIIFETSKAGLMIIDIR